MKEAIVFCILVLILHLVVYLFFRFLRFPDYFFRILLIFSVVIMAFGSLMFLTGIYVNFPVLSDIFEKIRTLMVWIIQRIAS